MKDKNHRYEKHIKTKSDNNNNKKKCLHTS